MGLLASILQMFPEQKRLRVGGFTFTQKRDGTLVARTSTNRKPCKRKGKSRSESQQACRKEFKGQRKFYKAFRAVVMVFSPAWDLFAAWARRFAHTGDNCFHAINHKYMDGNKVGCPRQFHFSQGELGMPWDIEATREGDVVLFTWHDDRDCPHARGTDRLLVGVIYDDHRDRPVLYTPNALRSDGGASIVLESRYGRRAHLYLYFERADKRACSDDWYVEIT